MADALLVDKFIGLSHNCRKQRDLGNALHLLNVIRSNGLEAHSSLGNHLVPMFVDCGSIARAQEVFDRLLNRNVHAWTSLVSGYAQCGSSQQAFNVYTQMKESSVCPNSYTLVALLKACHSLREVSETHFEIAYQGFERDVFVGSTLVDLYVKRGALLEAHQVFNMMPVRTVISWTALIAGYADNGFFMEAINCRDQMEAQGLLSNDITLVCVLKACGGLRALGKGQDVHMQIVQKDLVKSPLICCSLVDMYAKCGAVIEAQDVFDKLPIHDVTTWNALISGYVEHGHSHDALSCFEIMREGDSGLDAFTLVCVLKACGNTGAKDTGFDVHREIALRFYEDDLFIRNTLVDMYAKCGLLVDARKVFDDLKIKDIVSWNAMLKGYCVNHYGTKAIHLFECMQKNSVTPDSISFTSVLNACSQSNLAHKGIGFFKLMITRYGIVPTVYHFTCLVGLLARSGSLCEAEKLLRSMTGSHTKEMWLALLSACKSCSELELGYRCFYQLVQLEPECSTPYMLMANLYASAGRLEDAVRIADMRKMAGAQQKPLGEEGGSDTLILMRERGERDVLM